MEDSWCLSVVSPIHRVDLRQPKKLVNNLRQVYEIYVASVAPWGYIGKQRHCARSYHGIDLRLSCAMGMWKAPDGRGDGKLWAIG